MSIWQMFLASYVVTCLMEILVSLMWKVSRPIQLLTVLLVNMVTNPLTVALTLAANYWLPGIFSKIIEIMLEIGVVFAEAGLFGTFVGRTLESRSWPYKKALLYSLTLNAASYMAGLVINWLIP